MGYTPISPGGFDPTSGLRMPEGRFHTLEDARLSEAARAPRDPESDLGDVVFGSLQQSAVGTLMNEAMAPEFPVDFDFDPEVAFETAPKDNLNADMQTALRSTTSQEEFDYTMEEIQEELQYQSNMQEHGIAGVAIDMLGSVVGDPTTYISGGASVLTKGNRLARMAKGALWVGAGAGIDQAIVSAHRYTKDEEDIAYAVLMGAGIGGALSSFGSRANHLASDKEVKRLAGEQMEVMDRRLAGEDTADLEARHTQDMHNREDYHQKTFDKLRDEDEAMGNSFGASSAGAAEAAAARGPHGTRLDPEMRIKAEAAPEAETGFWSKFTWSDASRIARSKNPLLRSIGAAIQENPGGPLKGKVQTFTASLRKELYNNQLDDALHRPYRASFDKFSKAEGYHFGERKLGVEASMEFDRAVTKEMNARLHGRHSEMRGLTEEAKAAVREASDALDELHLKQVEMQNKTGVTDGMPGQKGYLSRKWNAQAMVQAADNLGEAGLNNLIVKGLRLGASHNNLDPPEELLSEIAKSIRKRFTDRASGIGEDSRKILTMDDTEDLVQMMRDSGAKEEIIDLVEDFVNPKVAQKEGPKHLRKRALLDLDVSVYDATGKEVSLIDLVSHNVQSNVSAQNRTVAGLSAMADAGYKNINDFDNMLEEAAQHNTDNWQVLGYKSIEEANKAFKKERKLLEVNRDLILGKMPEHGTPPGLMRAIQVLKDVTNVGSLGMMGIPQLAETGRILAANGILNTIRTIPELRGMYKRLADGTLDDIWLRDMEAALDFRIGDDVARNPYHLREELGGVSEAMTGRPNRYDQGVAMAKNFVGKASGQQYILQLQNKIQMRVMAKKFFDLAQGGKANMAQMRELGMQPDVLDDVLAQIKKHGSKETGLQMVEWPTVTRERFADALMRANSLQIQKQLVGETAAWMHSPLGSMLAQFRTFSLTAIEKQTKRFFKSEARAEQYMTFAYTSALAAALYAGRMQLNTVGMSRQKRRKYLKKRLTGPAILEGGAGIVGQLSVLPEMSARISNALGRGSVFDNGRGTRSLGASDRALSLVPFAGKIKQGIEATDWVGKTIAGKDTTSKERKSAFKTAAIVDAFPIRAFANMISE